MSSAAKLTPHALRVKELYRRLIKWQGDWLVQDKLRVEWANYTRYQFDSRKAMQDPAVIAAAIKDGQKWLDKFPHPVPYTIIHQKGGSSYQRYAPVGRESLVYPYEHEAHGEQEFAVSTDINSDSHHSH